MINLTFRHRHEPVTPHGDCPGDTYGASLDMMLWQIDAVVRQIFVELIPQRDAYVGHYSFEPLQMLGGNVVVVEN